ncbi:uncharacterized protein LOC121632103 isoform X1 [Melanotaenia boesemani]|uniref:uncharacterized protein LOC121632103 isoform X1 n=1 Tax=Melanotaenia boesemani TaxID=1250792 RepID=UPI001C05BE5E|nr:uncharacterized protein LOC121632103 isoform X1 [Melanotaenia boesemani]XP_041829222.1 uncharacterized protein LOC121632103 isoform X1 [Melanotaenia boesemani]XP_041829223.1 uncharacterized protein LOC121632103 isoform X1 [Melanotaenia boesemani]
MKRAPAQRSPPSRLRTVVETILPTVLMRRSHSSLRNQSSENSNIQKIITRSEVIKEGSPTLYKLITDKDTIGPLRTVTFGKKDVQKTNKTILLVGETGTGKSTLINALANFTMGVKWEDESWFQIIEEEMKSQTESQTPDVIVYKIFGFGGKTLPYSLTIIDTPGYGDTKNIEQDAIVSQKLFDLFRSNNGVHEVDAVGLVIKASDNRLSNRLIYIFNSVMSLFGSDMERNIVVLITHSDGVSPENALQALKVAKIKCARKGNNEPVHFLFNNCQHNTRTEKDKNLLKNTYKISDKGMREFTSFLENTAPQKLKQTLEVLNDRIRLTACIQNLQDRIQLAEIKQTKIKQTQGALKKNEQEMKMNQNFTVEVDEVYTEKQAIDGGTGMLLFYNAAVTCPHCEENCHFPGCTIAWTPEHCEVMKNGRCTVCTGKCLASAHVKEKWRYVNKTKKVIKTEKEMKEKYESKKAACEKQASLLESLQKEKENLEADKVKWLNEAYRHIENLNKISLNVNSLSTYVPLDFLIEMMKETGDKVKALKLEEMSHQAGDDRGLKYALNSMWNKVRGNKQDKTDTAV